MRRAPLLAVLLCLALPASAGLSFDGGDDLTSAQAARSDQPMTMVALASVDNLTATHAIVTVSDESSTATYVMLSANGSLPGDFASFATGQSAGPGVGRAESSIAYSANTWQVFAGVQSAPNSRAVYLDGENKGTNAGNIALSGVDTTCLGARTLVGAPGLRLVGDVGWAAIYSVALSDDQVASLAAGCWPGNIDGLVGFWRLSGLGSTEVDSVGGVNMTNTGATKVGHKNIHVWPGSIGGME